MKVIVVRDTRDLKSLGLQGLAGSTPARGTKDKCMTYVTYLPDVGTVHTLYWMRA